MAALRFAARGGGGGGGACGPLHAGACSPTSTQLKHQYPYVTG